MADMVHTLLNLRLAVGQNQNNLYTALDEGGAPLVTPNELVRVRVVEEEGPLKNQLELCFLYDCPQGAGTKTTVSLNTKAVCALSTQSRGHAS